MAPSDWDNHVSFEELEGEEEQEEEPEDQMHAWVLKFLYEAVKGALLQSVLTSPPRVAQSSAFQRLEYIHIAWFFGNGIPLDPRFLNSRIGVPSTENLVDDKYNVRNNMLIYCRILKM